MNNFEHDARLEKVARLERELRDRARRAGIDPLAYFDRLDSAGWPALWWGAKCACAPSEETKTMLRARLREESDAEILAELLQQREELP